jgi:hypothetical protein
MLFGEHEGDERFTVVEATAHGIGRFAGFVRIVADGFIRLDRFFRKTGRDYRRFNYLGEWHSHPSFALRPSATDDATMIGIVENPATRAHFVALVIVKLDGNKLQGAAFAYFPDGERRDCTFETARDGGGT